MHPTTRDVIGAGLLVVVLVVLTLLAILAAVPR